MTAAGNKGQATTLELSLKYTAYKPPLWFQLTYSIDSQIAHKSLAMSELPTYTPRKYPAFKLGRKHRFLVKCSPLLCTFN